MIFLLLVTTVATVAVLTKLCLPAPVSHAAATPPSGHLYQIHNKQVYFTGSRQSPLLVDEAHARTFQVLSAGHGKSFGPSLYARDFLRVYYNGKCIPGADPVPFQVLGKDLGRDDRNVFKAHALLSADAKNFKCLGDRLSKDSRRVYFDDRVISEDAPNFRFVGKWQKTCIYKDRSMVFVGGKGCPVADVETFDYAGNGIFTDHHQSYRFDGSGFQVIQSLSGIRNNAEFEAALG